MFIIFKIWFQNHCFQIKDSDKLAIENLQTYLNNARLSTNEICREFTKKFDALFRLEEIHGSLKVSPIYLNKINQWLHNDETLIEQIKKQVFSKNEIFNLFVFFLKRIIKIYNRHTHEEMLYNYMRSQRPQSKSEQSAET
jgi:hypothetical protein